MDDSYLKAPQYIMVKLLVKVQRWWKKRGQVFLAFFAILAALTFIVKQMRDSGREKEVVGDILLNAVQRSLLREQNEEERKDWHDYDQIRAESERTGNGENGTRVFTMDSPEKEAVYGVNGFNALASDQIALDRSLPDIRHEGYNLEQYGKLQPRNFRNYELCGILLGLRRSAV
ncbi:unnamed protein product [Notodromas monacha]|uniref:Uncharacterized protein n=1 Tax=Notodromas monacha TaxID=399045 RepID=A0A7R9GF90_9CRUS|nr:unnamed protein product [Notodromas monacha]CAG0918876.1 unnamed protein product [Notodromas monacha]